MTIHHTKKVVLITGCSKESGFGFQAAKRLKREGNVVVCTVRDLNKTPIKIPSAIEFKHLDLENETSISLCVSEVIKTYGRIDVLVNNAAYGLCGPIESLESQQLKKALNTNVVGTICLIQEVLPHMKKNGYGHIITISSILASRHARPFSAAYRGVKSALETMMESLAIELLPWHIKVTLFELGRLTKRVSTEYGSKSFGESKNYQALTSLTQKWLKENTPEKELSSVAAAALAKLISIHEPPFYYQSNIKNQNYVQKWRSKGKSQEEIQSIFDYYKQD